MEKQHSNPTIPKSLAQTFLNDKHVFYVKTAVFQSKQNPEIIVCQIMDNTETMRDILRNFSFIEFRILDTKGKRIKQTYWLFRKIGVVNP